VKDDRLYLIPILECTDRIESYTQGGREAFIRSAEVYSLTETIADTAIHLRRTHGIRLPDAVIAATALVHDCAPGTRTIFPGYACLRSSIRSVGRTIPGVQTRSGDMANRPGRGRKPLS